MKHDVCIDVAFCVDGWTDITFEANFCDSIRKTRHAKCFDCIPSSGIENVDADLCAEPSMLFFMHLLARPYAVLGTAAP